MSFLLAAALAVGLLVALPVAAHLLRRGRSEVHDFPPARLVPVAPPVARQRSRLEDRLLFLVRALLIALLALLGATPFVRCSRLSLDRSAGASVALSIIVDDSLSMRAESHQDGSRHHRAIEGARELLGSAREGDAVAIVLAGRPARLALAATTDLGAARAAIEQLEPSDRATDIAGAVQLARSALDQLPHVDKRVVLLSDLAGGKVPDGKPPVWTPLAEIRTPVADCGIANVELRGRRVTALVACSTADAAKGRRLEIVESKDPTASNPAGGGKTELPTVDLLPRAGVQTLTLELAESRKNLDVRITGTDALRHDDEAPIAPEASALTIGVVSDRTTASVETGGPPIVEQALAALETEGLVMPIPVVPDDKSDLDRYAAIILDDPAGIAADARFALREWLEQGGVSLALLGPGAPTAQLGANFEPFIDGAVRWEKTKAAGGDPSTVAWLGAEGASLAQLNPRGRALFDKNKNARVLAKWDDGAPFLLEVDIGRGLAMTASLPSSVNESDFALRPAFLALLDHVIQEATRRTGPRRTIAGTAWAFPATSNVSVVGPAGKIEATESMQSTRDDCPPGASEPPPGCEENGLRQRLLVADVRGRYTVRVDDEQQERIVTIDADEILRPPREANETETGSNASAENALVDASPEFAMLLLGAFVLELLFRLWRRATPSGTHRRATS